MVPSSMASIYPSAVNSKNMVSVMAGKETNRALLRTMRQGFFISKVSVRKTAVSAMRRTEKTPMIHGTSKKALIAQAGARNHRPEATIFWVLQKLNRPS